MQHESVLNQFTQLAELLRYSRQQHNALLQGNLDGFADLLEERRRVIAALQSPPDDVLAPSNVSVLPTSLTDRERGDDQLAIQILLRAVVQQDQQNEALLPR